MWSLLILVPSFLHCLFGHSKNNEDLRQQNSELEERLRILVAEKAAAQLGVEELQKKLEMSELLLQQVRGAAHTPKPQAHSLSILVDNLYPSTGQFEASSWPAIEFFAKCSAVEP